MDKISESGCASCDTAGERDFYGMSGSQRAKGSVPDKGHTDLHKKQVLRHIHEGFLLKGFVSPQIRE